MSETNNKKKINFSFKTLRIDWNDKQCGSGFSLYKLFMHINIVNVFNSILTASVQPVQTVVSVWRTGGYVVIGLTRSKKLLNRFNTSSFIILFTLHLILKMVRIYLITSNVSNGELRPFNVDWIGWMFH